MKNTTEVLENNAYLLRKRIFYVKNVSQGVKQCFTGRETMFYYQQIYVSFFKSMFIQIAYSFHNWNTKLLNYFVTQHYYNVKRVKTTRKKRRQTKKTI